MTEHTSTDSSRSRWVTRISIALAVIAALVVLAFIGFAVTVYVVTETYESIHHAARSGDTFVARCFLLRRADVNAKDKRGETPLHVALYHHRMEVAKLLIENGADVNAKDNEGKTTLLWTAYYRHTEVTELLIQKSADINAKDNKGRTPLAVAIGQGHKDIADLLRKHGAK